MIPLLEQAPKSHGPRWQKPLNYALKSICKPVKQPERSIAALRRTKGSWDPFTARWGMRRHHPEPVLEVRLEAINNPFWRNANRDRRCVVPVTAFFVGTPIQPWKVTERTGDWLWCLAFWEKADNTGHMIQLDLCVALIDTPSSPAVDEVQPRMPALLDWPMARIWLYGGEMPRRPWGGDILLSPIDPERLPPMDDQPK